MSIAIGRMRFAVVAAVLAAALSLALVSSSFAGGDPPAPTTTNNATVEINGGNARALAACVNVASKAAKHSKKLQINACKNFAKAEGGDVRLKNVDIEILQAGNGDGDTENNATVSIRGGDATAVAACVNYLEGDASSAQVNLCKNTAVAKGGDVTLKNVTITVTQVG